MAEKGIVVEDAGIGESVACRDASEQDDSGNPRIIQLYDNVGRKANFDMTVPVRTLTLTSGSRGDNFYTDNLSAEILNTAISPGDADSVVASVTFPVKETDSKIIVTPVVFDVNDNVVGVLEPKSFNQIGIKDGNLVFGSAPTEPITGLTDGNLLNHTTITTLSNLRANSTVQMSEDGTQFISVTASVSDYCQYTLSTPFDLSTHGSEKTLANPDYYRGVKVSADGTKLFAVDIGTTDTLFCFTMGTPWDITTCDLSSPLTSFVLSSEGEANIYFSFSRDGKNVYFQNSDLCDRYILSTPWDINTMSFYGQYDFGAIKEGTESFEGCEINNDGTKYVVIDKTNDAIVQFTLSTPYDINSAEFDQKFVFSDTIENNPGSPILPADGQTILFTGGYARYFHVYDMATPAEPGPQIAKSVLQSWNTHGAEKIGFHLYHDSVNAIDLDIELYVGTITHSEKGYAILDKGVTGQAGSFPVQMQYGSVFS